MSSEDGSGSLIVQGSAAALAGLAVLVWRVAVAETCSSWCEDGNALSALAGCLATNWWRGGVALQPFVTGSTCSGLERWLLVGVLDAASYVCHC
jgi:hypothetical protein